MLLFEGPQKGRNRRGFAGIGVPVPGIAGKQGCSGKDRKVQWLEQNIDAYRIIAELLIELRKVLSAGLKENFGSNWASVGLPGSVYEGLIRTKENESAVDWYEDEYQELFNFTTFTELHEILQEHPDLFPCLADFLPTKSLLAARFMELEVIRSKIARVRPIGEVELNFLMKFHQHFSHALEKRHHNTEKSIPETDDNEITESLETVILDNPSGVDEECEIDTPEGREKVSGQSPRPVEEIPEKEAGPGTRSSRPRKTEKKTGTLSPPRRKARRISTDKKKTATPPPEKKQESQKKRDTRPVEPPKSRRNVRTMIEEEDTGGILRELFLEVTKMAENLFSSDVPESPAVWNAVRISPWYEKNFVSLGLKPLSDFHALMDQIHRKMESGLAEHELKELLQEAQFSQILFLLRDMFKKNGMNRDPN